MRRPPGRLSSLATRFSSLRAFTHPGYPTLWGGAFVSNVGTWMETIAIGVFVTTTTGRAGWTGTIAALMYLPAIVLSPLGGALADRMDRRRYVAFGNVAHILLAASLTALAFSDRLSIAAIGVVAMFSGCVTALLTPAFSALLSDLVPPEDLHSAFSLSSAQYNLGRILGPVLAAAVITHYNVGFAFAVNTASFVAVLVAVLLLPPIAAVAGAKPEPLMEGIRNGLRAARADKGIRLALLLTLALAVLVSPFVGLVPVMAIKVLGGGARETSLLVTCQGLGAVSTALLAGTIGDWIGRRRLLEVSAFASGLIAALYWLSPRFIFAGAALFLLGGAYLLAATGLHIVCQARAPRRLQARVSSLFSVLLGVGYALGVLAQGWLGDLLGSRIVAAVSALLFVGGLFWARGRFPLHFEALEGPSTGIAEEAVKPVATIDGPTE